MEKIPPKKRRQFFFPIKWKLFLVFFILLAFVFSILGFFLATVISMEFRNQTEENLKDHATHEVTDINHWFEIRKNDFLNYAELMKNTIYTAIGQGAGAPDGSNTALKERFMTFLFHYPQFIELFLIDPETGKVIVASGPVREGTDVSNEQFFIRGKDNFAMSRVQKDPLINKYVMFLAVPIQMSNTDKKAVLAGVINAFAINDVFIDEDANDMGEKYLLISEDRIPFAGYPNFNPDNPVQSIGLEKALQGMSGHEVYLSRQEEEEEEEVIGHYSYLSDYGIVLLVEEPTDDVFAPLNRINKGIIILMTLSFVLGILILFWVSSHITIPLNKLTEAVKSSYKGRFKMPDIRTGDEIEVLGRAFGKMADDIISVAEEKERMIDTLPYPLYIVSESGFIVQANRMGNKLTGFSNSEITGRLFLDMAVLYKGKEKISAKTDIRDLFKGADWFETDAFLAQKNHHKFPVSLSGSVMRQDGKIKYYIIAAKDLRELKHYAKERIDKITPIIHSISIGGFAQRLELPNTHDEFTELIVAIDLMARNLEGLMAEDRKKAEQLEDSQKKIEHSNRVLTSANKKIEEEKSKAESILSSMGEGLIVISPNGDITVMNHSAEKMFGKSIENVIGKEFNKLFVFKNEKGQTIQPNTYPILDAVTKKKQIFTITYFIKEDGTSIPLATTVSPILFGKKLFGIVATFRDVSKEMEVDKAKSEFVSIASHQLRTPLTGVRWLIEAILKKGRLSIWQTEFLHDALQSNNRMIGLVNDLLNLSRLETGSIAIKPVEIELIKFLNSIVRDYSIIAKEGDKIVVFDNKINKLPITCDPQLLTQVVVNLLSNAIKYTNKKTKVYLTVKKKGNTVEISVKDNGIGISTEDQKRLFTKFFRTDQATKMTTSGSGLGLYIVKKIITILGGSIYCVSKQGEGSIFSITIPIKGVVAKAGDKGLVGWKIS